VVLRFRRSRGVERQQLKWFTYAAALAILFQVPNFQRPGAVYEVLFGLTFAFIPVAAGLAVLRDRLYDIDRLIDRTLVYGLLSVLLALVSAGGVFILGPLLNPAGGESALAIAASASTSIWTRSPPSCWRWLTRPCSRPTPRCGCGRRPTSSVL
jgi:hypothetical protein